MKKTLLILLAIAVITGCNQKDKQKSSQKKGDKPADPAYVISKNGIGELKLGMTQEELEKLLNQKLVMKHAKDTGDVWSDTALVKYKDIEVSLYFDRQYSADETEKVFELIAIQSSSPLCKTAGGLGTGDNRDAILSAYEDNPIDMGPVEEMVNDTTWVFSKTKYYISVKDDKWDKQLVFHLTDKKVSSVEATIMMGE